MLRFQYVAPAELSQAWDGVRQGLEVVQALSGDHWRIEDVYCAIKNGVSHLHIGKIDDRYAGFVILTPTTGFDGPVLHIWAAYSAIPDIDMLNQGMPELDQFARNMGAKRITFSSRRKGWEKRADYVGFKPTLQFYEKEVAI